MAFDTPINLIGAVPRPFARNALKQMGWSLHPDFVKLFHSTSKAIVIGSHSFGYVGIWLLLMMMHGHNMNLGILTQLEYLRILIGNDAIVIDHKRSAKKRGGVSKILDYMKLKENRKVMIFMRRGFPEWYLDTLGTGAEAVAEELDIPVWSLVMDFESREFRLENIPLPITEETISHKISTHQTLFQPISPIDRNKFESCGDIKPTDKVTKYTETENMFNRAHTRLNIWQKYCGLMLFLFLLAIIVCILAILITIRAIVSRRKRNMV